MLDRQSLRDFEMRVLFQMNANDSSSLMDTPEASRLGVHRAIFYDEGQGRMEKFRPYGLPSADWLAWVKAANSALVTLRVTTLSLKRTVRSSIDRYCRGNRAARANFRETCSFPAPGSSRRARPGGLANSTPWQQRRADL